MTRHDLHQMIDQVPDTNLPQVARFLEALLADPVLAAMESAPYDDEPYTEEDEAAFQQGLLDYAQGRTISLESLMQKYGVEPPEL